MEYEKTTVSIGNQPKKQLILPSIQKLRLYSVSIGERPSSTFVFKNPNWVLQSTSPTDPIKQDLRVCSKYSFLVNNNKFLLFHINNKG